KRAESVWRIRSDPGARCQNIIAIGAYRQCGSARPWSSWAGPKGDAPQDAAGDGRRPADRGAQAGVALAVPALARRKQDAVSRGAGTGNHGALYATGESS